MPWSVCGQRYTICENMNCNECKDQVFELIDREAFDPEGVRQILDRCPDCRRLFDEIKTALARVEQLPIEEPPAAADAAILRAAAARRPEGGEPEKHWLLAPPWAMAAIALLAVGIGIWAVPGSREIENRNEVPAELVHAELEPAAGMDDSAARDEQAIQRAQQEKSIPAEASTHRAPARRSKSKPAEIQSSPAAAQGARRGANGARKLEVANEEMAAQASASADLELPAAAAAAPPLSEACRTRIARLEARRLDAGTQEVGAEDALALGQCYQAAGNERQARVWLERAATDPKTRSRARRALRALTPQ